MFKGSKNVHYTKALNHMFNNIYINKMKIKKKKFEEFFESFYLNKYRKMVILILYHLKWYFFGKLCPKFQMCDDKKANGSLKREKSKLQRQKCKKKFLEH